VIIDSPYHVENSARMRGSRSESLELSSGRARAPQILISPYLKLPSTINLISNSSAQLPRSTTRKKHLTSLPIGRKTPLDEMNLEFRHFDHYPHVFRVHSVLNTVLYAFFLRKPICSKKNTAVLVVPLIVSFMVSSTALCFYLTTLLQL
jgi:hypothetical protein